MTTTNRPARLRTALASVTLAAAGIAAAAQAATPESGTVSPESPRVAWAGTLTSSGVHQILWEEDPSIPCPAPICDSFALTVAGPPQDLTIGLNIQSLSAADTEPGGGIRVTRPDGQIDYLTGTSGPESTLRYKLKGAQPGDYEVTVNASFICCGSTDYTAFAEVPAPETSAPAGPSPGPAAPGTGQGDAAPRVEICGPRKASARKLKRSRRLRVTVQSSGRLESVSGWLAKGRRTVATGRLDSLDGKGRLTLRLSRKSARKLKKGRYVLSVSGTDAQGRTVGSAAKLKLRR